MIHNRRQLAQVACAQSRSDLPIVGKNGSDFCALRIGRVENRMKIKSVFGATSGEFPGDYGDRGRFYFPHWKTGLSVSADLPRDDKGNPILVRMATGGARTWADRGVGPARGLPPAVAGRPRAQPVQVALPGAPTGPISSTYALLHGRFVDTFTTPGIESRVEEAVQAGKSRARAFVTSFPVALWGLWPSGSFGRNYVGKSGT